MDLQIHTSPGSDQHNYCSCPHYVDKPARHSSCALQIDRVALADSLFRQLQSSSVISF